MAFDRDQFVNAIPDDFPLVEEGMRGVPRFSYSSRPGIMRNWKQRNESHPFAKIVKDPISGSPAFTNWLHDIKDVNDRSRSSDSFTVLEVSSDGAISVEFEELFVSLYPERLSEFMVILSQPKEQTSVRLILVDFDTRAVDTLFFEFLEKVACALTDLIDPSFYWKFVVENAGWYESSESSSTFRPLPIETETKECLNMAIGPVVIHVSQKTRADSQLTTIFMLGSSMQVPEQEEGDLIYRITGLKWNPRPFRFEKHDYRHTWASLLIGIYHLWNPQYLSSAISSPVKFLFPLLQLRLLLLRKQTIGFERTYSLWHLEEHANVEPTKRQEIDIYELRDDLRLATNQVENQALEFLECAQKAHGLLKDNPELQKLSTEANLVFERSKRIESLVRDRLTIDIGKLALQESKRSIEQSVKAIEQADISIKESKRVKVVTFLAFIFIPLNFVTSLFGMNLNEFMSSPPSLNTFFATAFAISGATFLIWGLTSLLGRWRKNRWLRMAHEGKTVKERVRWGLWIIRNGHMIWGFKSGAFLALFTDSRSYFASEARDSSGKSSNSDSGDEVSVLSDTSPPNLWTGSDSRGVCGVLSMYQHTPSAFGPLEKFDIRRFTDSKDEQEHALASKYSTRPLTKPQLRRYWKKLWISEARNRGTNVGENDTMPTMGELEERYSKTRTTSKQSNWHHFRPSRLWAAQMDRTGSETGTRRGDCEQPNET